MASNVDPTLSGQLLSAVDLDKVNLLNAFTIIRDELSAAQEEIETLKESVNIVGSTTPSTLTDVTLNGFTNILGGVKARVIAFISGPLTMEEHSGAFIWVSGDIEIPSQGGFSAWIANFSGGPITITATGQPNSHVMADQEWAMLINVGQSNCLVFRVVDTDVTKL